MMAMTMHTLDTAHFSCGEAAASIRFTTGEASEWCPRYAVDDEDEEDEDDDEDDDLDEDDDFDDDEESEDEEDDDEEKLEL
jgi:hypothetical protein